MKKLNTLYISLLGSLLAVGYSQAHTVSVGYEAGAPGSVNFWYGTYHSSVSYTEGSIRLVGNGLDVTSVFTQLVASKPAGLIDGTTNFYSNHSALVGTYSGTVLSWQGAVFTGLTAGTYVFTYIPIASPTSVWAPTDSIILSSSVTLSAAIVGGSDIDNSHGSFPTSGVGGSVNPVFSGGTLQVDAPTTVNQSFTITGAGGTIDQAGKAATFSGVLSDATPGTPGALTVANSGAATGAITLTGVNTFTGATTVDSGGTLALSGAGSIANSSGVTNNGTLDISGTSAGASITTLSGGGAVTLGARNLTLTNASGSFGGAIGGTGGVAVTGGIATLTGNNNYSGGTTVVGSTLIVGADANLGAPTGPLTLSAATFENTASFTTARNLVVTDNATLNTAADTTLTLAGVVQGSGSGCFTKSGSGTLNMTGDATLAQGTCVQNGMLRANAVLNSTVTVDTIGVLRGAGTVNGGITVHGRLAPGNSPGTLTTHGTVTMLPGSTFQVDINGTGTGSGPRNYSRLLITGAGNQFIAGGATLAPNLVNITGTATYIPYVPVLGDRYRIVTAEGGIVGQFAPLTQPLGMAAGTRMVAFYNVAGSNSIDLGVLSASYIPVGGSTNAQAAGAALNNVSAAFDAHTATPAQNALLYQLTGFNDARLAGVVKSLAGEIHGAMAAAAPRSGQFLQGLVPSN